MTPREIPYPGDTRAKGWRFEIDMEKVRQSDTWAVAGALLRPWLLLTWSMAWEQTPCGSLPNDDELIAARLEMPIKDFQDAKGKLLRGWWLAEDGRLYHDTIVERVLAMLEKRAKDAKRTADSRAKRAGAQAGDDGVTRDKRVTHAGPTGEFDTKHQAPSTSTGNGDTPKAPRKRRASAAAQLAVSVEALVADGVQLRHAEDWLAIRAKKGLILTQTAWDEVKAQAVVAGLSNDEAIRTSVVNTWGGFKAVWLKPDAPQARASPQAPNRQEAIEARNRAAVEAALAGG